MPKECKSKILLSFNSQGENYRKGAKFFINQYLSSLFIVPDYNLDPPKTTIRIEHLIAIDFSPLPIKGSQEYVAVSFFLNLRI